jgi:hypothetical protein
MEGGSHRIIEHFILERVNRYKTMCNTETVMCCYSVIELTMKVCDCRIMWVREEMYIYFYFDSIPNVEVMVK